LATWVIYLQQFKAGIENSIPAFLYFGKETPGFSHGLTAKLTAFDVQWDKVV
jgi:hypothetical protein